MPIDRFSQFTKRLYVANFIKPCYSFHSHVSCSGSDGVYEMSEIPPGDYTLRIIARRPSKEKAILRNKLRIRDNGACVIHSISNGLRVTENRMTIGFLSTGEPGPTGYLCSLDRKKFVECK